MASTKTSSAPSSPANIGSLYDSTKYLMTLAEDAHATLENDGDLGVLRDQLGALRDRSDSVQSAVMGFIASINEYL
jgi:hypothetical protein